MKARTVHILTVIVDNEFGVITRITAQIRREGWSIKSLAVSEGTDDSALSRITLGLTCYDTSLPTVVHRISRLNCVRSVTAFEPEGFVCSEMLLARVSGRDAAAEVAAEFGAVELSRTGDDVVYRLVDSPERADAFVERLMAFNPVDIARTGAITMEKINRL